MKPEIYLVGSDESFFTRDITYMKKIARIHRQERVDAVFVNSGNPCPLTEGYCAHNRTASIDLVQTKSESPVDIALDVVSYSQRNPEKNRFVHIGKEGDLEERARIFGQAKFSVKKL